MYHLIAFYYRNVDLLCHVTNFPNGPRIVNNVQRERNSNRFEALQSLHRSNLISGNIEAVCIEVSVKDNKCLVSGFHRPPNTDSNYWDIIKASFDNMSNSPIKELILLRNFNCDVSSSRINKIAHLASSFNPT